MLGNKLLNIRFAKYHIWNNKSEGFPNMVLSNETFNQSVCTEYSEAVNDVTRFNPYGFLMALNFGFELLKIKELSQCLRKFIYGVHAPLRTLPRYSLV